MNAKMGGSKKNLDEMMLEYLDMTGSGRAHTFPKSTKEKTKKADTPSSTYKPKPAFPQWCFVESQIPPQYRRVESLATKNGILDTTLLYPILMSSGLHRDILGHIWFLVNQSMPGQLAVHELYAALALIALAQNNCPFTNLEVLHSLPGTPVPFLQLPNWSCTYTAETNTTNSQPMQFPNPESRNSVPIMVPDIGDKQTTSTEERHASSGYFAVPPASQMPKQALPKFGCPNVGSRLANYSGTPSTTSSSNMFSILDEEFSDFQQATEMLATTFPTVVDLQAPARIEPTKLLPHQIEPVHETETSDKHVTLPSVASKTPLQGGEDKYSVFRALDQERHMLNDPEDEFGDFLAAVEESPKPSINFTPTDTSRVVAANVLDQTEPEDLFAGWDEGATTIMRIDQLTISSSIPTAASFLDQPIGNRPETSLILDEGEDEFGDFISPVQTEVSIPVLAQDNISAENQSIASLELSPLEAAVSTCEMTGGLQRQSSLPSLDLKLDSENDFAGDAQSLEFDIEQEHKTQGFSTVDVQSQNFLPLSDRYSFVSNDTGSEMERNINEWAKCLESCQQIINGAYKNFTDISSVEVCKEVINSVEGENYIKNIVEIYKLVSRIRITVRTAALENDRIRNLLDSIDCEWAKAEKFVVLSPAMLSEEHFDYTNSVLKPEQENNENACGVCLLDVNIRQEDSSDAFKLTYGGRQYHATCANFWVNCVNSLLPALVLQQLL